ncbi:MAG: hypothetical protein PHN79_06895 [Methanoregula sp.]|nr:hypothetical protein [Methanoregula sp.]
MAGKVVKVSSPVEGSHTAKTRKRGDAKHTPAAGAGWQESPHRVRRFSRLAARQPATHS